jgi:hypothetical protein
MKTKKTLINRLIYCCLFIIGIFVLIGLNSCSSCVDVHTNADKAGTATLVLNNLNQIVSGSEKKYVKVSFNGQQSNGDGEVGATSFTLDRTFPITSQSVAPVSMTKMALKPGDWLVTVSTETWSTSCTKSIASNANTTFTFNYNQNGCQ